MSGTRYVLRLRRAAALSLAVLVVGAGLVPEPASADGPGYGGTADALIVAWQADSSEKELVLYAVGFRSGSTVQVRVGSQTERALTADPFGAVDLVLASAVTGTSVTAAVTGASVLVTGHTPAGTVRTLIGAVPPIATTTGAADVAPWAVVLAGSVAAGLSLRRRRGAAIAGSLRRYRHPARHRV